MAAIPSRVLLAIKAIVALAEEIFSENFDFGDEYVSEIASSNKPRIQPSSVIEPNSYLSLMLAQMKNKSEDAKLNKPVVNRSD